MRGAGCFYLVATHLGGAERSLLDLLIQLKKRGREFVVLAPRSSGPLLDQLRVHAVRVEVLEMPESVLRLTRQEKGPKRLLTFIRAIPALLAYFGQVVRWTLKNRPEFLHTTGIKCHLFGAIAGRLSASP